MNAQNVLSTTYWAATTFWRLQVHIILQLNEVISKFFTPQSARLPTCYDTRLVWISNLQDVPSRLLNNIILLQI